MSDPGTAGWKTLAWTTVLLIAAASAGPADVRIFQGHQNGRVEGFEQTDLNMFQAHPMESFFYSESWNHVLWFEKEGIVLLVNFQLHNLGVNRGNLNVIAIISDPSGKENFELNYFQPSQFQIAEQDFGISAGGHSIRLEDGQYHLVIHGEKIQADFIFKILAPSFQMGDGILYFLQSGDFGRYNDPIPWAEVSGTLSYGGQARPLRGWGTMSHDWQVLPPSRMVNRGKAFWLYSDQAVILGSVVSWAELGDAWVKALMVAGRGRILFSSHDFRLEDLDPKPVPGGGPPCPSRYRVEAVHGEDWLRGEIKVRRIQQKAELMTYLPGFLRKLAEMFFRETWAYLFLAEFRIELHVEGTTRVLQGTGLGNFMESAAPHR